MLIRNKSNTIFRHGSFDLCPQQMADVPESFLRHPIIIYAMKSGKIEKVEEDRNEEPVQEVTETVEMQEEPEEEPAKAETTPKKRKKAE